MFKIKSIIFASIIMMALSACGSTTSSVTSSIISSSSSTSEAEYHTVIFDTHGGSPISSQSIKHGEKITKPNNPTKTGYDFINWTYQGEEWSFIGYVVTYDMTLDANWEILTYSISYDLDGGTQNPLNPTTYTIEDNKSLYDPTKTGYTFTGWYNGDTKVTSIPKGTYGDLTLTAHWSINSYNVTVTSSDTNKGTVSGGGTYEYGSNVTVTATPIGEYVFNAWFSDSGLTQKVSKDSSYSFVMAASDVTLYAKFWTKAEQDEEEWPITHGVIPTVSKDGKYITYGMYPQTNVNDSSLISTLDTLTDPNEYGYYFYNNEYYYKYSATPYSDPGDPSGSVYTFDNGTTIVSGTAYWFKVEPIKWVILDNEDGTFFITTESLLVNHRYNELYSGTKSKTDYQGNTATVYANNYKYSDIRSWINTDFYNQAFFLDNDNIIESIVDNSVTSTLYSENPYACENTNDKLFLLSAEELTTSEYGFATSTETYDKARQCKTTDYARAHGAYMYTSSGYMKNGWYYTRSPYCELSNFARFTYYAGDVYELYYVDYSYAGVRPGLRLSLGE